MDYNGKVVVVTGGAHGIGKSISWQYARLGATVYFADIDAERGRQLMRAWNQDSLNTIFYAVDLTDASAVRTMMQTIRTEQQKIDILINNAGKGIFKPLTELTIAEWDEVINLNLRAAFITAQEFAKQHEANEYGRIINISSTRYLMSEPGSEAYAASKGGLVALTHALALSLSSRRLTVNAISPGWIKNEQYEELTAADHEQHPAKRVGKPEDIVRACLFLTDEQNDFLTGQNLVIDGGMTRKMIYVE